MESLMVFHKDLLATIMLHAENENKEGMFFPLNDP